MRSSMSLKRTFEDEEDDGDDRSASPKRPRIDFDNDFLPAELPAMPGKTKKLRQTKSPSSTNRPRGKAAAAAAVAAAATATGESGAGGSRRRKPVGGQGPSAATASKQKQSSARSRTAASGGGSNPRQASGPTSKSQKAGGAAAAASKAPQAGTAQSNSRGKKRKRSLLMVSNFFLFYFFQVRGKGRVAGRLDEAVLGQSAIPKPEVLTQKKKDNIASSFMMYLNNKGVSAELRKSKRYFFLEKKKMISFLLNISQLVQFHI